MHHATVKRIIQRYEDTGNVLRKQGGGRPKIWTQRTQRLIIRLIMTDECTTAVDVRRYLMANHNINLSLTTLRRILRDAGLNGRVRIKKNLLTAHHRKLRLTFARKYAKWERKDWLKVIFADETRVERYGSDGKLYCWRRVNEQISSRTTKPKAKKGNGISVWGCIGFNGVGCTVRMIDCTMDQDLYVEILEKGLLPSVDHCVPRKFKNTWKYLHDNAPTHTAYSVSDWLIDNDIVSIKIPPYSPDINVIEHLWALMKKRISQMPNIKNKQALWEAWSDEWQEVEVSTCRMLIESLPDRINAIINANGGVTKN